MKYLFYAIVFDVAGNITLVGSSTSPAKTITTNIQKVTGISINPSTAQTKNIGDTFKITATVSPSDANNKSVNWSSSNTSVATVDSNGNVRCLAAGTATITATAADGSGKSASLSLTVYEKVTITTFTYSSTDIFKGNTSSTPTVSITGTAKSGPTYTSSNTSIATVNSNGVITGVAVGTTIITINYTNYDGTIASKTCSITIKSIGPNIATNPSNTIITCTSSYVTDIAIPATQGSYTYFGITRTNASELAFHVNFNQNISSAKYSWGTSMPTSASSAVLNSNSNTNECYYGTAIAIGDGGLYVYVEVILSNGKIIIFEGTRTSNDDGATWSKINIYDK